MNISNNIKEHLGPKSYDDKKERIALKYFLYTNKDFQKFVVNYVGITGPIDLIFDPLGEYKVDAGIVQDGKLIGLIEVDYYTKWSPSESNPFGTWPYNYRWCHALVRKFKYWQNNNLPYIACTFNMQHTKMLVSTNEMQEKYMHTKKIKPVELANETVMDWFLEIPLSVAKKFGDWTEEELKRVS